MLVRADEFSVVDVIKSAEQVDREAAVIWLRMGLYDALGELIDEARPEIDRVWKASVAKRNSLARRALVRAAVERRVDGDDIDDVVKAAAGLSLVNGYVAKADDEDEEHKARSEAVADEKRDARGRWTRTAGTKTAPQKQTYDMLQALTTRPDEGLRTSAEGVAGQMQGTRYDQMRVLGNALVATGHPTAGGAARIAAEVGPSAEQVLGTHLRRAAYRYRGTEKRPDKQLVRETKETTALVSDLNSGSAQLVASAQRELEQASPGEWGKNSLAVRMHDAGRKGWSDDQLELRATGDVAAAYLMRQLPTADEAMLSQEAGRTPPSVGVIIDRDGDVVSEAMGYQGDHYVPFDLKNLKRLHGGSYVRTRALGGPTSEDIYTGLLSGARQVQVASRSGVFTIEFDPDLRGGRRYSDKARQMVDRYSRLLDVVESGTRTGAKGEKEPFYTQDIDEDEKRKLKAKAAFDADYDETQTEIKYQRALRRARAEQELGYTDEELTDRADTQLQEWIGHQRAAGNAPSRTEIGRQREQVLNEVRERASADKEAQQVRRLKLNAEGYYKAMQSLRREFPYFIRDVDYEALPDFEARRRTRAPGEARAVRAAGAAAAQRTHVQRGALLPREQARAYDVHARTGNAAGGGRDDDTGEAAAAAAKPAGGPSPTDGGAGAAAQLAAKARESTITLPLGQKIGETVKQVILSAEGLALDPLVPSFPDRETALNDPQVQPKTYLAWLGSPGNQLTNGSGPGVARFLTEQASDAELSKVVQGFKQIDGFNLQEPFVNRERLNDLTAQVQRIRDLRFPFADAEGDPALHMPDEDDPKPYPFKEIADVDPDDEKAMEDLRRKLTSDPRLERAFKDSEGLSEQTFARQIRTNVSEFRAAEEWGKKAMAADEAGRDRPSGKPAGIAVGDALDIARDPKNSPEYKDLLADQQAYAWKKMNRVMREAAGGAAPKAPLAIEKRARRVVWHDPADPLSQALAKRLSRRR